MCIRDRGRIGDLHLIEIPRGRAIIGSMEKPQPANKSVACVDLFCGAGGLTHGLIKAGLPVVAGVDIDPDCEYPYTENNSGATYLMSDVRAVTGKQLKAFFGNADIKILAGCAPCQPFSTYSHRYEPDKSEDSRWRLLEQFLRIAVEVRPDVVTMENVPQLAKQDVFLEFVSNLEQLNYTVTFEIVDCAEIGLPQSRKRLVLPVSYTH